MTGNYGSVKRGRGIDRSAVQRGDRFMGGKEKSGL